MNAKNLAAVGLKLLAVWCLIEAVESFTLLAPFEVMYAAERLPRVGDDHVLTLVASLVPGAAMLMVGILLWVFSPSLAGRLAPPDSIEAKETVCSFEQLQALSFAAAGILIVTMALPGVGHTVQQLGEAYNSPPREWALKPGDTWIWISFAGVALQVAIGLTLLLCPRGFGNIWRWLRTAGT